MCVLECRCGMVVSTPKETARCLRCGRSLGKAQATDTARNQSDETNTIAERKADTSTPLAERVRFVELLGVSPYLVCVGLTLHSNGRGSRRQLALSW